ncbi:MAG: hypothetical protein K8U57_38800 [Planctomycetes bacterium]|nr:hypothetical protein [Planctomycetota bacterium]
MRVDLVSGTILDPVAKLAETRQPIRPFLGPDRITQDEQYLWQPSLDPVRMAGKLKKK